MMGSLAENLPPLKPHHKKWLAVDWVGLLELEPVSRAAARSQIADALRWYVYVLWRTDLGAPIPFYVGKGTRRRVTQHTAPSDRTNRYKTAILAKLRRVGQPELYSIASSFDREEDALDLEMELVSLIGRAQFKEGPLANRTDGGDGTQGHIAKSGAESHSARAVIAGHTHFGCVEDAASTLGVTGGAIAQRIRNGWPGFYYVDEGQQPQKEGVLGRYRRPVHVPSGLFPSMSEAEVETGESVKSIFKRIRFGWDGYYYPDEGQRPRLRPEKPCQVEGRAFSSQLEAAAALGITLGMFRKRLRSSNFPDYVDLSGTIRKEVKAKPKGARVFVDGLEYKTASHAAQELSVPQATILYRARSSNFPTYIGEGIEKAARSAALAKASVSVRIGGKVFDTLSAASRAIGVDISTLKRRCQSPSFPDYLSDDPALAKREPRDGRPSLIGVVIDGVRYRSINEASAARNELRQQIRGRLDDPAFPNYVFAEPLGQARTPASSHSSSSESFPFTGICQRRQRA